ncbi:MAG TPA: hypothetical protein VF017_03390 [Thermoanaerobaculia bacterium]|nr:hypothetical protein [Thermoanaerobaculia bacterium]
MRRARCWGWVLVAMALAALEVGAVEAPEVVLRSDGVVVVRRLPSVLSLQEVRPHLDSGLTTTFQIEAGLAPRQGSKKPGAARVEVRFEPWDEVYLASVMGGTGERSEARLASLGELETWWRELEVPLARGSFPPASGPWTAKVELAVVPFSYAEQQDTQRWLSRSLAEPREAPTGTAAEPETTASPVLDILLATSIRRPRVVAWQWSVPLAAR